MKLAVLFCAVALCASAQTIYEAEASGNQVAGSADFGGCSVCSGHRNAQNLGGPGNGTLTMNNIKASAAGSYKIAVTYDNGTGGNMPALVSANGGAAQTLTFPSTGSWLKLSSQTVTLPLRAGSNSIRFVRQHTNWVAEIDKITVTPVVVTPPPPPPPPVQPPPPPPPSGNTVLLTSYGSVGHGGNDTSVFQNALNLSAANNEVLEIPAGSYNVAPLNIPSNATVVVDAGATVTATSGYSMYQRMLNVDDAKNVSITGTPGKSIFQMRKSEYTSGEYRHCLDIEGSSDVSVSGIACNDSGGDGLYIGAASDTVSIANSTFDNNRRQGFSLTSGKNITIDHCAFTNTIGTLPEAGIDIEPNGPSDLVENVLIENTTLSGNRGDGIMVPLSQLNSGSHAVSITLSNLASSRNGKSGFFFSSEPGPGLTPVSGSVLIENSTSTLDGWYGAFANFWSANGPLLTMNSVKVVNANQTGITVDDAAIGVEQGGGGTRMGNVLINAPSITDTTGKLKAYFTVEDFSNAGESNIHVSSPATLSGADTFGIVNGNPVSSININ